MLCEKCHKSLATVRYAEVVDGKVKDLNLCADCLAAHQEEAGLGFEFSKPGAALSRREALARAAHGASGRLKESCKGCGQELAQVLESGEVGCSGCYETFAEQIGAMLEGLHVGSGHRGKAPQVDDARARVRTDLQTKRTLLRSAVGTENYEEAAHLRDEIRVLERELTVASRED